MVGRVGDPRTARWSTASKADMPGAVLSTLSGLEAFEKVRQRRFLRSAQLYEGRTLSGLAANAYYSDAEYGTDQYTRTRFNLARSVVQTALAKVAGKQKPKAQFCVTDSDWSTKRKAKNLERLVEAVLLNRQANMNDAWEVAVLAFRDCLIGDCGVLKFWADPSQKKVAIRRVLPWQIVLDPAEAENGDPQSLFHVYGYDRENLIAQHPEHEAAIVAAPAYNEDSGGGAAFSASGSNRSPLVKVRECWRLPMSDTKPGTHAIVLANTTLVREDWKRDFFPFEFFVWEPWMCGMFGTSLVDIIANIHDELNAAGQRWAESERMNAQPFLAYQEGTVDDDSLQSNAAGNLVKVVPGTPRDSWPMWTPGQTMGPASIQWFETMKALGYEFPGVSQSAATGNTQNGVTAGVAMRTQENIATERFDVQWQQFERVMAVGATRQIIACLRELHDEDPGFTAKWPGAGFLKEIKFGDVSLEDDQYIVQPYAVSGLVNTPQDRLSLATELFDRQLISQEAYFRIIQSKDIDGELDRANMQSQLIEKYVDSWLDADPEEIAAGRFKRFRPPEPACMNLQDAIVQVGRAYLHAEFEDAPDEVLGLFKRWMSLADAAIKRQQALAAEQAGAAKGSNAAVQALGQQGPQAVASLPPPGPPQGQPMGGIAA